MDRAKVQVAPEQMLACWLLGWVPRQWSCCFSGAIFCLLVGEVRPKARAGSLWVESGILGLVPAHWYVELGPGASGWRACGSWVYCLCNGVWGWVLGPLAGRAISRGGSGLRVS